MKKVVFCCCWALFLAVLSVNDGQSQPLDATKNESAQVVLELENDEENTPTSFAEQLNAIRQIGVYFDENYLDAEINSDFSDEVRRIFPQLQGSDVYAREQNIRDGVKFYRLFADVYTRVKEVLVAPEDPPLMLGDDEYESDEEWPYIDSPDAVIISDFKSVVSYSSNPREAQAYLDKYLREKQNDNAAAAPLQKIGDILLRLDWKNLFIYGKQPENTLFHEGGEGEWSVAENDVAARWVSSLAGLGNETIIKAALHIYIPDGKILLLTGKDKPIVNVSGENLVEQKVFLPLPKQIKLGSAEYAAKDGNFAFPVELKAADINQNLNVKAELKLKVCDNQGCREVLLTPQLELAAGEAVPSLANNFVKQSFLRLPKEQSDDIEVVALTQELDNWGKSQLRVRLKTDENPILVKVFVDDEQGYEFGKPRMSVADGYINVFFEVGSDKTDLIGKKLRIIAAIDDGDAVSQTLEVKGQSWLDGAGDYLNRGMLLMAMVGGVLLSFMPWGFPLLVLKLLSINEFGARQVFQIRRNFGYTSLGIVLGLSICLAVIWILRLNGVDLGWGIEFKNPYGLVLAMLGLTWAVAEIAGVWRQSQNRRSIQLIGSGLVIAFIFVMSWAPYLPEIVGFALTQDMSVLAAIWVALMLGAVMPYVLIWAVPSLAVFVPQSGRGTATLRQLAVGLAGAAIALLLLRVALQAGWGMALLVLSGLALLWLMLVFWNIVCERIALSVMEAPVKKAVKKLIGRSVRGLGLLLVLIMLGMTAWSFNQKNLRLDLNIVEQQIDLEQINKDVESGKIVLVKIEAGGCLLCKVNEYMVFKSPIISEVMQHFEVVQIDVDNPYNPEVLRFMQRYGRSAAPCYVIFSSKVPYGMVLPSFLTEKDFRKVLASLVVDR